MKTKPINLQQSFSFKNLTIIILLTSLCYSFTAKQTSKASDYLLIEVHEGKRYILIYVNKKEVNQEGEVNKFIMLEPSMQKKKRKFKKRGFGIEFMTGGFV